MMRKQSPLSQLRMEYGTTPLVEARRVADTSLGTGGMRMHLLMTALITLTFWVGCLYLVENMFAAVPWVTLYQQHYTLYRLLDVLFYLVDGAVIICIGLPLLWGCATVFHAAAHGRRLGPVTLFDAFTSGRAYRRAIALMTIILLPRIGMALASMVIWHQALTSEPLGALLLWLPLALLLTVGFSLIAGLDDALPSLALAHPDKRIAALCRRSVELTYRRLGRIWLFKLSYLGPGLLSVLTLGILLLGHTLPHYVLSHAVWTDDTYSQV